MRVSTAFPPGPSRHAAPRGAADAGLLLSRVLALFVIALAILGSMALAVGAAAGRISESVHKYTDIKIPKIPVGPQTTFVYDNQGNLVTTLHAEFNRTIVPLSKMSAKFQHAVIAIEDRDFYRHGAIDPLAIVRAAYTNVSNGEILQGGSTITQQLVKNLFTGDQRTLARKIHEAVLAMKLENRYSKNAILAMYLNTVYFGHGAYGAETAAQTYFGVPASKLSALQGATLAALVAAPGQYDPVRHRKAALARRNIVLQKMAEQGYITPARATKLQAKPLKLPGLAKPATTPYPYFMQYVTQRLLRLKGYDQTFEGGLRVASTIDVRDQQAAEQAVAAHLPTPGDPSAALVAIDPSTGAIRAMVGGRNFAKQQFNLAAQGHRQTGSAAKMFTLMAAMEQGISLNSIWHGPPQLTVTDPRCRDPQTGKPWEVANAADGEGGTMTLKEATAHSINTIFAQVVLDVGPENVVDVMHLLGIRTKLQAVCSITLGTQAVTPLEMTSAYATVAAGGVHRNPTVISSIKDAAGRVLYKARTKGNQVVPQNDAYLVSYALQGVVDHGTGTAAAIPGRQIAGKTGTNQSFRDAWFCGYTPQLATCVWMGYRQGEIPMTNVEGVPEVFGGTIPAAIWHDFMAKALAGLPDEAFPTPDFSKNTLNPPHSTTLPPSPSPSSSVSLPPTPVPTKTCPFPNPKRCHHPSPSPTAGGGTGAVQGTAPAALMVAPLVGLGMLTILAAGRRRPYRGRHRASR